MPIENEADGQPKVSIVLIVANRRGRSAMALKSALAQDGLENAEILLIDSGVGDDHLPGADDPRVRSLKPAQGASFGEMKALGLREARGEIVAYMEDHVELRPGWLQGILGAMDEPWTGLGAEVHNANPGVGLSDALALINYGLWAPPLKRGRSEMLPGNNTVYRRAALLEYDQQLDDLLLSDTVLQFQLLRDGRELWLEPEVSILHRNPTTLKTGAQAEFHYHWCFGAVRAKVFHWSRFKKARYILLSPAIPWLRSWRLRKLALKDGAETARLFNRQLLAILIIMHAAVIGQSLGILFGLGDAGNRFTEFELNSPRPKANEL